MGILEYTKGILSYNAPKARKNLGILKGILEIWVLPPVTGGSKTLAPPHEYGRWGGVGGALRDLKDLHAPPRYGGERNPCSPPRWGGVGGSLPPIENLG